MVIREEYLNKLKGLKDKNLIKIITGIRRCGKSTLLEMFRNYLTHTGSNEKQIIDINFENMDFSNIVDAATLHEYITSRLNPDTMNYIFLDEVQMVKDFPRAVDSLFLRKNVDIYLTGSNALMLSGELATLLSGRYIEIQMLPLSFKEYINFLGDDSELNKKFYDYLQFSSFPYSIELYHNKSLIRDYLGGIYNTIIVKDIISRKKISDVMMLESVIKFLFSNIGNLCSTKKISDTMTSLGRKISTHTIESYISGLKDSFIFYQVHRYDVKGKQVLKTLEKYYAVDMGLRYYLLGNRNSDLGYMLENIIYLELIRRGNEVHIGKIDELEVDFISRGREELTYIQSALTVRDKATLERELYPLNKIKDHFPKILITLDDGPPAHYNGIRQINAIDFLLGK